MQQFGPGFLQHLRTEPTANVIASNQLKRKQRGVVSRPDLEIFAPAADGIEGTIKSLNLFRFISLFQLARSKHPGHWRHWRSGSCRIGERRRLACTIRHLAE